MNQKTLMKIIGEYDRNAERLSDEESRIMKSRESTQLTEELEKVRAYFQEKGGVKVVGVPYLEVYHDENATVVLTSNYVSVDHYTPNLGQFHFYVGISSKDSIDALVHDLENKFGMRERLYPWEWEKIMVM